MEVTITVPNMKCARCSVEAPLQLHLLYVRGQAPSKFRQLLSELTRERSDATAKDSTGRAWEVFTSDRPAGWGKGPSDKDLCSACLALWTTASAEAGTVFLTPPKRAVDPKKPVVDLKAKPAVVDPKKVPAPVVPKLKKPLVAPKKTAYPHALP